MTTRIEAFDEVYEVVCTRIVHINGRTIRVEVQKVLKGNQVGRYTCGYYEEDLWKKSQNKRKRSNTKTVITRIEMPWVYEKSAEAAKQRALDWIAEKLSASNSK